jgi:hypothetical protein
MKANILKIHDTVFKLLRRKNGANPTLLFQMRKSNKYDRLAQGFWFRGNMHYLCTSFWSGNDWKEKVYPVSIIIDTEKNCELHLSAQDPSIDASSMTQLANLMGCKRTGTKNKWVKRYKGAGYIEQLKNFLAGDKARIDEFIHQYTPRGFGFLVEQDFGENLVILRRHVDQLAALGATNKIVKICWNAKGWRQPSGPVGKSKSADHAYEADFGFGHEEWLLDRSRIVDGYHYAFVQPLSVRSRKHDGQTYHLSLFTHHISGNRYYVGELRNVYCIDAKESARIYTIYEQSGWIEEMKDEVGAVGGKSQGLDNATPSDFFNIRFQFSDAKLVDGEPCQLVADDLNITSLHYKLLSRRTALQFADMDSDDSEKLGNGKARNEATAMRLGTSDIEFDLYHGKLQNALYQHLTSKKAAFGYSGVYIEAGRVDIKAQTTGNEWHYFEIKTDNPKMCIRKAIGQLLEYAYYPTRQRAARLIIVGDALPSADTASYMEHMRRLTGLPVYYRRFDLETKDLSEEY